MNWFLITFALTALTSICNGLPTGSIRDIKSLESVPRSLETTGASSLSSARKLPTNDVGLPSELAWQAWLVVAKKPDAESSFESATVPRRISPKSVFIAPSKQKCPDGYKVDSDQECIKDVIQFNYKAHLDFLVQRLKANYPSALPLDDSSAVASEQKQSAASGPTQVNISLGIEDNWSVSRLPLPSEKFEREVLPDDTMEISVVHVPPVSDKEEGNKNEAVLTQYEVENGTNIGHEIEGTFFRGNTPQNSEDHAIREIVVPVAEIIDDGNKTLTEVIDYEIPPLLGHILNGSKHETTQNNSETKIIEDSNSPTVVLLLSPTQITDPATSTLYSKGNDSHTLVKTENLEVNPTEQNGVSVDMSTLNLSPEDTTIREDEEVTLPVDEVEVSTVTEVQDTIATTNYPDEDPEDTTDSNDEILDHGEAGMLVSAGKLATLAQQEDSETDIKTTEDTGGGNISSESSISGDVILETTLLDLNTGTTPLPIKLDDLRKVSETEESDAELKPEVVFWPQESHKIARLKIRSTSAKPPENPTSLIDMDDPLSLDSNQREPTRYVSLQKKDNESDESPNTPSDRSHLHQRRRTTTNNDYIRFPEDPRHPSSSYVLFPSDHSNSINGNLDYKERSPFTDDSARPHQLPKSSVPLHQKKTHWHLPPGWRIDDLQPPRQLPVSIQNGNPRQNQMLLRFWNRMPLFRDPSLTINSQSSRTSQLVTQRDSVYRSPIQSHAEAFSRSVRRG